MATTYKIGEAAALLDLKTYVLRFWETEFPDIVPLRTEKGQRMYTEEHLALLERIRFLLHERGLTIGGARKILAEEKERGTTYVFGSPAVSELGGFVPSPDEALAGGEAEDDGCGDFADEDAAVPFFPEDGGAHAAAGSGDLRQCNLPGLEALVALRARMLDAVPAAPEEDEDGEDAVVPDAGTSAEQQGMLPLFAVAKAAWLAGRASGGTVPEGGHNFIAAGASDAAGDDRNTRIAEDFPVNLSSAFLNDIVTELEEIAALLEADHPAAHKEEEIS